MKINRLINSGIVATALALACSTVRTQAQTIITNTFTFDFPNGGNTSAFNSTWLYWYNQNPGYSTPLVDPTTDASNPTAGANTSSSGSLEIISPLNENDNSEQDVFFGTFAENPGNAYDFSIFANMTAYSSVSFDILVASGTALSPNGDYGAIGVGFIDTAYGYNQIDVGGNVTIPASAVSNWYHINVPLDPTQTYLNNGSGNPTEVAGLAFDITSYSGYPKFTFTNWLDNIKLNGSTAPPPPPPSLLPPQPANPGLNLMDTTLSSGGAYNRYQIADTNDNSGGLSFVGQSSVTYSWGIKSFPTTTPSYSYQAHFFLVSGSDSANTPNTYVYPNQYDQAADYNLANCIFLTIQSDGNGGGVCNFRYKTNQIGGNGMLFNTVDPTNTAVNSNGWPIMPVASLDSAPLLGTWSLTFAGGSNVTITSPSGATTNFVMDPASAALFHDPCTILLGAQPNGSGVGFTNSAVVYSNFSLSGDSAAFADNFLTDSALDTTHWENLANDPNGVVLVPANAAYWVPWTLPAIGFGLYDASILQSSNGLSTTKWSGAVTTAIIKNGSVDQALMTSNNLPAPNAGYFSMVSNSLSQLLVLFPGQTFTPGVAPGYSGMPTEVDTGGSPTAVNVTVIAVDTGFNLVSSTDSVNITGSTDSSAYFPATAQNLVNGTTTFEANGSDAFYFGGGDTGNLTVTATDLTNPTVTGTSAPVVVN